MVKSIRWFTWLILILASPAFCLQSDSEKQQPEFTDQQLEFFETKVRPILVNRCHECHSGEKKGGGLSLESRKAILHGGDYGPAIEVGDAEESLIIDAVNYGDFNEMPPRSKLPQEEIDILTKWVIDGAAWPANDDLEIQSADEFDLNQRKSEHWCWNPVVRPKVPSVEGDWARDPIDHFIQQKINEAGLKVAPRADRSTLLRRVSFDLTGLPPSPELIKNYVQEETITFEAVVDQLLASPHFGERWARHWMDLTRYAETCGHEFDYPIQDAYRYRDYLIRAFNADVPYDQFVREHIAGDLLSNPRRNPEHAFNESILGTGFWFLGEATHAPVDVKGDEAGRVDNQIDVMTKTFLGLTVACARCHDHKFDAISTKDYYALSGFLQSSRRQRAVLDFDGKIQSAIEQIKPLNQQALAKVNQLSQQLSKADSERLASYLDASIRIARTDPRWFTDKAELIQGETLRTIKSDSGTVETQEIKPEGKLKWQGDKQTWWRDGQAVGHSWELEFEVAQAGEYSLALTGTVARDYGAARIFVNESKAVEKVDFFGTELTTKSVELGKHPLKQGKQRLRFELLECHPEAIRRNMIGIDFLSVLPLEEKTGGIKPLTPDQVADEMGLDADVLRRFLTSLNSSSLNSIDHPLHTIRSLVDGSLDINQDFFRELKRKLDRQAETAIASRKDAIKFADFDQPDHGWFLTGHALEGTSENATLANENEIIPSGVLNSGQFGGRFYGAMRSQTFEISHNNVHVRLRGKDVQLRLVIDGFVMDQYNALLFNGALVKNATHDQFQWRTQSGDIKKYIGHRAHFEVVDNNDGFAAIDEIWFSNGPAPKDFPSSTSQAAISKPPNDLISFCNHWAKLAIQSMENSGGDRESSHLLTWTLANDLVPAWVDPMESQVSSEGNHSVSSAVKLSSEIKQLRKKILEIANQTPQPQMALAMTDGSGEDEHVFVRGNHKALGEIAPRQFLEALVGDDSDRFAASPGSGRMQLVDQIIDGDNPLTARVMANRIWHHLTGKGIVATVDNFGVLGSEPTHPELLDYLASEYVENKWSTKSLIRQIVLSSTYQSSSKPNPAAVEIDPDNNLLHRARIRRLQGEAIRDSILAASGQLDRTLFGYSVPVHLTPFMQGRGRPGSSGPLDGHGRRSIYTEVRRNFLSPMMLAFDAPIPFNSTGRRNLSNVPAQALILMNDPFVIEQAAHWAEKLCQEHETLDTRLTAAYQTAFGRQPTQSEVKTALRFIEQQSQSLETDSMNVKVWQDFCHVIFNVKEFIYIK